jgi:hypothetical protein
MCPVQQPRFWNVPVNASEKSPFLGTTNEFSLERRHTEQHACYCPCSQSHFYRNEFSTIDIKELYFSFPLHTESLISIVLFKTAFIITKFKIAQTYPADYTRTHITDTSVTMATNGITNVTVVQKAEIVF